MTRRIRLLEEDYEQTSVRLTTASGKLEEASKFAEESERSASPVVVVVVVVAASRSENGSMDTPRRSSYSRSSFFLFLRITVPAITQSM